MRLLKAKDFLKVIKGEDIEFRIKPFAIQVKEPIIIDGITCRCSLNFPMLKFDTIEIRNSRFECSLIFNDLKGNDFSFNNSSAITFKLFDSTIDKVSLKNNEKIEEIFFDRSSINDLSIVKISDFKKLYLGCQNNVMRATFNQIGSKNTKMAESSVYICPEQFGAIDIQNMYAARIEIGTFGKHSVLNVNGIFTDDFNIKNCDNSKSQVSLKNINPLGESVSQLTIEDSVLDGNVMSATELERFTKLSVENSQIGTLAKEVEELKKLQKVRFWKRNISNLFLW